MTSCDDHDAGADSLNRLMNLAPDPEWAERVFVGHVVEAGEAGVAHQ